MNNLRFWVAWAGKLACRRRVAGRGPGLQQYAAMADHRAALPAPSAQRRARAAALPVPRPLLDERGCRRALPANPSTCGSTAPPPPAPCLTRRHPLCLHSQAALRKTCPTPAPCLLLGEWEGGHLDEGGERHDGPAVGVGHVEPLQAVLQDREVGGWVGGGAENGMNRLGWWHRRDLPISDGRRPRRDGSTRPCCSKQQPLLQPH